MMLYNNIDEKSLQNKRTIITSNGDKLSWEYLSYVKKHPVKWTAKTHVLYGAKDNLVDFDTISSFAKKHNATLTIMPDGEHWFHTKKQMEFLADWIKKFF